MLTSRFPYGLSCLRWLPCVFTALDYFLFNGNLTALNPLEKMGAVLRYFILALFDLFDMIFMSRKRQFMSTLFLFSRDMIVSCKIWIDQFLAHSLRVGPYHAYLTFGLVVSCYPVWWCLLFLYL
jgi:hypothetical protein